jgi:hypothetical protein
MITITRATKAVVRWAGAYGRIAIPVVQLREDGKQAATNGHGFATFTPARVFEAEDLPTIDGFEAAGHEVVVLEAEGVGKVIEDLPRKHFLKIAARGHAAAGAETATGAVSFGMACDDSIRRVKKWPGDFPDKKTIVPKGPPAGQVAIQTEYLARVAASAKDIGAKFVQIEIWASEGDVPVRFAAAAPDVGVVVVHVMPFRAGPIEVKEEL